MQADSVTADQAIDIAVARHAEGDVAGAIRSLSAVPAPMATAGLLRCLATFALDAGERQLAAQTALRLDKQHPGDGVALGVLTRVAAQSRSARFVEAVEKLESAADHDVEAAYARAQLALDLKRGEEALGWLDRALARSCDHLKSLALRAAGLDELLAEAWPLLDATKTTRSGARAELAFAVAKAEAYRERHARAYRAASLGNSLQRAQGVARELSPPFPWGAHSCSAPQSAHDVDKAGGVQPILVCGLPRSGTSLVEQILARHPLVAAGGELPFFRRAAAWLAQQEHPADELLKRKAQLVVDYRRLLRNACIEKPLVVDKMPENWRHLPIVATLMPDTRVVRVVRDARDVATSIYMEHFAESEGFAQSFEAIASLIAEERDYFRAIPPGARIRCIVVVYEELVRSPQTVVPWMLRELGLDDDPACLTPAAADGAIATPSRWQVRQPINERSIGRWQNYAGFAPEAFAELGLIALPPTSYRLGHAA